MNTGLEKNPAVPQLGRELLRRRMNFEVTEANFDRLCAEWMMEFLNDYRKRPDPTPPEEILDYRDRKRRDPDYRLSLEFWNKPHIKSFTLQASAIVAINKSNHYWLLFMKKNTIPTNTVSHSRIDRALREYA